MKKLSKAYYAGNKEKFRNRLVLIQFRKSYLDTLSGRYIYIYILVNISYQGYSIGDTKGCWIRGEKTSATWTPFGLWFALWLLALTLLPRYVIYGPNKLLDWDYSRLGSLLLYGTVKNYVSNSLAS